MGNREDLLAGAKQCLIEKGYRRTSARDIATAAGTSLAAIGYHFGGKDNLLNLALVESAKEWGEEMERALAASLDPGMSAVERFEETWRRVIESFSTQRGMWLAQFRLLAELRELPDQGEFLVTALREGRRELAGIFQPSAGDRRVVGSVYHALLLGVMAQWLIDPSDALSSADLVAGLRTVSGLFEGD
ncbi:TetR/AcrR family transcriptional regulator [Actinocrispum sp. NPDC049592]|uniref:TetR/AcrR family transcriptional regulator n=1 Tax=Actinocrispum sp. NPDC049592 TaxID=3154835 RepID=UPI003417BA80